MSHATFCKRILSTVLTALFLSTISIIPAQARERWAETEAKAWAAKQPWVSGANFLPSNAINQLEMWQGDTFDPTTIDRELGWAEAIGMKTMRVFLHDLLWQQDPAGFKQRIDQFLEIADKHHIRPVFVFFDSCWDPNPKLGPQHPPIPGVHNSGWVQSPGRTALMDKAQEQRLLTYVKEVVTTYANDKRIYAWDLWNEPNNGDDSSYPAAAQAAITARINELLPKVFDAARSANPSQPLTSGVWQSEYESLATMPETEQIQINQSDIISFHNYGWPELMEKAITQLEQFNRPILCTEYMARGAGSTFDTILPILYKHHVGAINWGLVAGKSQTYLPWDSWQRPYVTEKPVVWFHDVFSIDGRPYREREAEIFREYNSKH